MIGPLPASAVGETIRVVVCESWHGKTRLGVTAPRSIPVHRTEIAEEIQAAHSRLSDDGCPHHPEERR